VIAVLKEVSLRLADYRLEIDAAFADGTTGLFGPSGSGKTSLLELMAGLRKPASGSIELQGRMVFDRARGIDLAPWKRNVGYVPQDDTLFPHLSVRQNVLYGAPRPASDPPDLEHVVRTLELAPLLDRRVHALSGGERKRIALARALLANPQILLLDEPLSGIDSALRTRVLQYLIRVRDEFRIPMIYVTHEMEEVRTLCTRMVVLERGRIVDDRPVAK
jgi:ABC-type molybdate transport system, ATPase component